MAKTTGGGGAGGSAGGGIRALGASPSAIGFRNYLTGLYTDRYGNRPTSIRTRKRMARDARSQLSQSQKDSIRGGTDVGMPSFGVDSVKSFVK